MATPALKVPDAILSHHIFSQCEVYDIINIAGVCKSWNKVVSDPKTLYAIYKKQYANTPENFFDNVNYKSLHIRSIVALHLNPIKEFCELQKNVRILGSLQTNTQEEVKIISVGFSKISKEHQNTIKRLIWIAGGSMILPNADFAEEELKNNPKSATISIAVEKYLNCFIEYDSLRKFEAVVNDNSTSSECVLRALSKLKNVNFFYTNLMDIVKYRVWEIAGPNSLNPDFAHDFIKNNPHDQVIKTAINDVRNENI